MQRHDSDGVAQAAQGAVVAVRAENRTGIKITGEDRASWLNGLITCDLTKAGPGEASYGLILEKKGRIMSDLFVVPAAAADALALAVPVDAREALVETLDHYLVMEDADLSPVDLVFFHLYGPRSQVVAEALSAPFVGKVGLLPMGGAIVAAEAGEAAELGARVASLVAEHGGVVVDEEAWEPVRIEQGLSRFGVEFDASLYPQEASLEKLAVSFDKGCYLGQEVVYMLEHRGRAKRKLVPLDVEGEGAPRAGEPVTTADGAAVGEVKSGAIGPASGKPVAIAMVRFKQTSPGTELRVGDRVARVRERLGG